MAHDYLAPLRDMRPIRRLPRSGHLPFAPSYLEIGRAAYPLVVGKSRFGVRFSDQRVAEHPIKLDWTVTTRLWEVDRHGRIKGLLEGEKREVHTVQNVNNFTFLVSPPSKPAFLRYDISFKTTPQGKIHRYSEYLRVVEPHFSVRLRTDAASYAAGSTVWFRLENPGTLPIFTGLLFGVDHFNGQDWVTAPFGNDPHSAVGIEIFGGFAFGCRSIDIPANVEPGTYRISQRVEAIRIRKVVRPTAEFTVVA